MALQQLEHIAAGFCDGCHFRNDWQIVYHKWYFVLLVGRQRLSMAQQTETGDIGRTVSIVFMHESSGCTIESSHRVDCAMIGFSNILFWHNQLDTIPTLRLIQPLVTVHGHLSSERLRQH